jgi:uncharacterized protein YkwD
VRFVALTSLAVLLAAAPAGAQTAPDCAGADVRAARNAAAAREAVLCIVNAERTVRGLPPVATEARLEAAAQGHSDDMAARGYFDHVSPEGAGPDARVSATGYPFASLHENIAFGQRTAREVMEDWIRSPTHCPGILAPEVIHLGVGIAPRSGRGPHWAQNFALPQDTPPASQDTAPASGCPYRELSIPPGPADIAILALGRLGRRLTVVGVLEDEGAGRRVVVEARRRGRTARRSVVTRVGGSFRAVLRAPRGRGRVRVTVVAPGVPGAYETGRDTRRV